MLLAACAGPQRIERGLDAEVPDAQVAEIHSDLIRSMLEQGQPYAALAHIEAQKNQHGETPELSLLEAEARRELGQTAKSEALYRGLLDGPLAGRAHHGLGLLYAGPAPGRALVHLARAAALRPTDPALRNDYGFALMRAARYDDALAQIATAVELDPESNKARNNLIILLILRGDEAGVRRTAAAAGVGRDELAALRRQASTLRQRSTS